MSTSFPEEQQGEFSGLPVFEGLVCPLPLPYNQKIVMGHGSGGKLSRALFERYFLPAFDNPILRVGDDSAVTEIHVTKDQNIAVSTDCHVVSPLFFPGGDIGRLAICGTVNDICMSGASPAFLTAGFILEEGLELKILAMVISSMQEAALEAGVKIIAGDTKVVQKGKADGLYINTTGVGQLLPGVKISGQNAQPGDLVILSGTVGDHGMAVLLARGELGVEASINSDVAPLNHLVAAMLEASHDIHVLRDPTRGGVATSLNEIAIQSQVGIQIFENEIPIKPAVASFCEMLGFDPLYVANEGKLIAIVRKQEAEQILKVMKSSPYGEDAAIVGEIIESPKKRVLMKTNLGSTRVLEMLSSELLPRIC